MSAFETIKAAYAAFGRNDPSVLFAAMDPAINWNEAEGNPLADRNPYVGPQAIGEGVFARRVPTGETRMSRTSVYLSSQFEDRPVLLKVRDDLVRTGYRVTSRWLDTESATPATALAHEDDAGVRLAAIAYQDIEDIQAADVVVVFNPREACNVGRGGRHVETGYALALGKKVVIVGARANVFHWMPQVTVVDDWSELVAALAS